MKIYNPVIILCSFWVMLFSSVGHASPKPYDLQCEHLTAPLGIDALQPRLSWKLADARKGAYQSAYRITVSTDSLKLVSGSNILWDSGKITSANNLITYKGNALTPFTKYYWRIELWDMDGKLSQAMSHFETGMIRQENWKGTWISDNHDINTKPAPYFRKEFTVSKKIRSARAYIACAGLYELYFNGSKTGNHRLDPMYTRFDRRTLYVTYDVTSQLQNGSNAIGILLGNGWYNMQSTAVWDFHKSQWRARPRFCMDLRITYEDGSTETIATGKDWKTALSPIIFNSIYTAEHYDARMEQPGWNTTNFKDSLWKESALRTAPSGNIVSQSVPPVRNVEKIIPVSVNKINDTTYVYDLGRNISGVSHITASGEAGTVIRLKHAERLYENGHADMSNIDQHYRPTDKSDPFQTDIFILSGNGDESFMPHFNYKGFQYVEVTSSKPLKLSKSSLTGYFMHSDVKPVGSIVSSNTTINKIAFAANSSYLSNLFGYPTDCPQREKNGWTGDAHIAVETGLYGYDGITIYEKWMADHRDEQQPNGVLPAIIPTNGWGYDWGNGPDWTSTITIIPWKIYEYYGDTTILSDNYENMKRYVDRITETSTNGLTEWGLGDWVPVSTKPDVEFTSSIYYFVDAAILAKTAKILGHAQDYDKYNKLATFIKDAFNKKYLNADTGIYGSGRQTELSMPLYWGVVPNNLKSRVAANLAAKVTESKDHLDVGLLGTKAILSALSENGYADLAYKIAAQETFPSWGWWIKNGATTLYENWNIDSKSDISLNHIMFGEVGAWLYKGLGGIYADEAQPGFKNVILKPNFVEGLNHFKTEHESPFGNIISYWKRKGRKTEYTVTIPPNSSATIYFPVQDGQKVYEGNKELLAVHKIQAGTYKFVIK